MTRSSIAALFACTLVACGRPTEFDGRAEIRSGDLPSIDMGDRFEQLHSTYLEADTEQYIPLLRASLRHARRLTAPECIDVQRQLADFGLANDYDGLEPLWLIYQDCAATAIDPASAAERSSIHADFAEGLSFALDKPHPQLAQRVSHYNSRLERGVRGDALRATVTAHAAMSSGAAQRLSLHQIVAHPRILNSVCSLPMRTNQTGQLAQAALLRHAACAAGVGSNNEQVCDALFGEHGSVEGGAAVEGLSVDDTERLRGLCDRLAGTGDPTTAGIDRLDPFSTDWCGSEADVPLMARDLATLVADCYLGNSDNPHADAGVTSANFDTIHNETVVWERDHDHVVASITTADSNGEVTGFFMGEGHTEAEALEALTVQLNAAAESSSSSQDIEGSQTYENEFEVENEDGTTTRVRQSMTLTPKEGGIGTAPKGQSFSERRQNSDGSGRMWAKSSQANGSWSTDESAWDKDGNMISVNTHYDPDSDETTVTVRVTNSDDEVVYEESTVSSGQPSRDQPGGTPSFDPHNPACQELAVFGAMPGAGRGNVFDELFQRGEGPAPETVNPNPEDDTQWDHGAACGASTLGGVHQQSHCSSLIVCEGGAELDENCQCSPYEGQQPQGSGCLSVRCDAGMTPTPVGAFGCTCAESTDEPNFPEPPDVAGFSSEMIWNRPGGEVFFSEAMLEGTQ